MRRSCPDAYLAPQHNISARRAAAEANAFADRIRRQREIDKLDQPAPVVIPGGWKK